MKKKSLIILCITLCIFLVGCGNKNKESNENKENQKSQEDKIMKGEDNSEKYDWNWNMEIIEDQTDYIVWQVSFYQTENANDEYPTVEIKKNDTNVELDGHWITYAEVDGKKAINFWVRTKKDGSTIDDFKFIAKHSTFESTLVPTDKKDYLYQNVNYANPENVMHIVPINNKWFVTRVGNSTNTGKGVWIRGFNLVLLAGEKNTETKISTDNVKFYSRENKKFEATPNFVFKDVLTEIGTDSTGYESLKVYLVFEKDEKPFEEWEAMKKWVFNHDFYYINDKGISYKMF